MANEQDEDRDFTTRIGPVDIDWPRALGFYGGIAVALALDVVAPELALFVAAVPLLKLLKRRRATRPERLVAAVLEGAAKPIGGDAEAVVRPAWSDDEEWQEEQRTERAVNVALEGPRDETSSWPAAPPSPPS